MSFILVQITSLWCHCPVEYFISENYLANIYVANAQEIGVVIGAQCKMKNCLLVCWSLQFWFASQLVLCSCLFVHSLVPSLALIWCMV